MRPARWSKKTDELVRTIAGRCRPRLQSELGNWLDANPRFEAFVLAHQDKVRKKLGTDDEESRLDVRAELLVAHRLLTDRRFTVAFEAHGARQAAPDLTVTFRTNQRFNIEVTRMRSDASVESGRLANVIAGKLRQLLGGEPNVLVLHGSGLTTEGLAQSAQLVKSRGNAAYVRLGGVFALEATTVSYWPNREARWPLAEPIVIAIMACFAAG